MNRQKAYFAWWCFWGVEYHFQRIPGVLATKVGYMWWDKEDPTYEQVSSHETWHVETAEITFDTDQISFETLAKLFFEIHDPTQANGQWPDIGNQYLSVIFYTTLEQKNSAQKLIDILKAKWYNVVTELKQADTFRDAETYHQQYYEKKDSTPYCHIYTKRF